MEGDDLIQWEEVPPAPKDARVETPTDPFELANLPDQISTSEPLYTSFLVD